MPRCAVADHLAASTPISVYLTAPGDEVTGTERFRCRLCPRHGHQALVTLLKRGASLIAEADLPEFCLSCAQPTSGFVYEAHWYEGDWSVAASFTLCADCMLAPFDSIAEAPARLEKLPPREKTPIERGRKKR